MLDLTPAQEHFVLRWGEVGTRWGINRTVARAHALLFISHRPLSAEEMSEALGVSRSGLSLALRELEGWKLVRGVHRPGDRKEYFEAVHEAWEMFLRILDERKRREIDPLVEALRGCLAEAERGGRADAQTRDRLRGMLELCELLEGCYERLRKMSRPAALRWIGMGGRVRKFLEALG